MAKKRRISPTGAALIILVLLAAALVAAAGFYTDLLWYQQLGFTSVFTTHIWTELLVGVGSFAVTGGLTAISIWLAYRNRPIYVQSQLGDRLGLGQYRDQILQSSRVVLVVVPIVLGLFSAGTTAGNWQTILLYLNRTPSGQTDPQFNLDTSFYLFELPLYNGLVALLQAAVVLALVAAVLIHLVFGGIRVGRQLSFSKAARIQIAVSAALVAGTEAVSLWLDQYSTMTSASGLYTGATFSDVNAKIPGFEILAGIGAIVALLFLVTAFVGKWRVSILATALMVVSSVILIGIYPWGVQTFQVVPNERLLEADFIKRNIDATRFAYGLDKVQTVDYNAKTTADAGALRTDADTTAQIRIIDPSLVSASFRQLEQYRQYYNFSNHLDVDRYQLDGKSQDTVIAVRELNQSGLGNSQSWFNDVIVYTHGYGLVAAYGNQRSIDGQPVFFQAGIPSTGKLGDYEPRIYFGENSPTYSIVGGTKNAKPQELDYPAGINGDQQTYTTFSGDGGPKLDNFLTRLAYALKFRSEQILLSDAINNNSQILYKRSPFQRVQAAAPYLTLDSDTYPAVVDGRVVWVIDGYTTSDQYPYSRSESPAAAIEDSNTGGLAGDGSINYIRNSVKATVDAYDGKVNLYAWDTSDPILKTWQKAFPTSLKPVSAMSGALLSHLRYPTDLFKIQRNMLGAYHVTEAGAFYSQQDAWMVPNDPSSNALSTLAQPPYYLTMQVPGSESPAFSLYSTFIPRSTGESSRNVLTGYLVADSDAGSQEGKVASSYGRLSLLVLPRDTVVPGPGQVQNNFNADSEVSKLLNLLRQGSTEVLNGNLLTLPVGGGLLYVQPVYIKSTGETSFPLLKKVLVAFGDQIAFEDSLDAALNKLFGGESGATAGDGAGSGDSGSGSGGTDTGSNQALANALAAAKQALADKAQAMADGDWKAYGEADKRLAEAIDAAIRASGGK